MISDIIHEWGCKKLRSYLETTHIFSTTPPDNVSRKAGILSFIIGFSLTLITASIDVIYASKISLSNIDLLSVIIIILVNIVIITLEFYLLFIIGFQATARYISGIQYHKEYLKDDIYNSLVRAVLELDEPNMRTYNLDPYKKKDTRYWFVLIIYKTKVILSNIFAKILLVKIIGRSGSRIYIPLVSSVVTGYWDFWVQNKILKKIRYRVNSRIYTINLIFFLKKNINSQEYIETLIRLISIRLKIYGYYNANLTFLLNEVEILFPLSVSKCINISDMYLMKNSLSKLNNHEKYMISEIASNLLAFKQCSLSNEEKELLIFFDINKAKLDHSKIALNRAELINLTSNFTRPQTQPTVCGLRSSLPQTLL